MHSASTQCWDEIAGLPDVVAGALMSSQGRRSTAVSVKMLGLSATSQQEKGCQINGGTPAGTDEGHVSGSPQPQMKPGAAPQRRCRSGSACVNWAHWSCGCHCPQGLDANTDCAPNASSPALRTPPLSGGESDRASGPCMACELDHAEATLHWQHD